MSPRLKKLELTLNMRIYSKKNSKRIFYAGNKKVILPSKQFMKFQELATGAIYDQLDGHLSKLPIFTGPVKIETMFYIPGKIRVDGDNLHTSILDVLQHAQVIDDDKNVLIGSYYKNMDSEKWKAIISIERL